MKKQLTLLFAATALCCIPAFGQVTTNDLAVDSLAGFDLGVALKMQQESHDPEEAEQQIALAKRNYIDQKYSIGKYDPTYLSKYHINSDNSVQSACSNVNFESGDFSNWVGAIGDNTIGNTSPLQMQSSGFFSTGMNSPVSDPNARHTIISSAFGNDPYGNFPGVPAGAGNYTVRMGGQTPSYQGELMEQTFTVSPSSTSFAYRYAVVLNDPPSGHAPDAKPYFKIEVLDQNGNPISPCTQYFVVSDPNNPGFFLSSLPAPNGDPVYCRPWTTVNFDLSNYVNQNITVRFTVAGCTQSGHFGYAYFDCTCSSFAASINFCPGNTYLYLGAPAGYGTYQWFDSNHDTIPGATNDTLLVNNPVVGDTFFVYLISSVDTTCFNILPIVLEYTHILPNAVATDLTCYGYDDGTASAVGTVGYAPYSYQWFTNPIQTTQTVTGLSPGSYTVLMTDSLGCEAYDTVLVTEPARIDTSLLIYEFCPGDAQMTMFAPAGFSSYTWIAPGNNIVALNSPLNYYTFPSPQIGEEYVCILNSPPNCPIYDSVLIHLTPPQNYFNPSTTVNVFTPNGDLKNDRFYPYMDPSVSSQVSTGGQPEYDFALLYIKSYEIWIYDRWGNEVFYSNDYSQAWDGTVKQGKECTDGVYFWICNMTSRCSLSEAPIESKGFVHLIR
ncbi:hypothetical protein BH11BAC7_BH11BAC7_13670 [soil metagenome]